MSIRKARISDINAIHKLINDFAQKGHLLPRSLSELYDHLRDYVVIERAGQSIIGVCGLRICWEDLAEIKSLAVAPEFQGKGYGRRLVEASVQEAREYGIGKVFTLTYIPGFFVKLGFEEIEKSELPQKIWADCLKCPHFPNCKETALIKYLY